MIVIIEFKEQIDALLQFGLKPQMRIFCLNPYLFPILNKLNIRFEPLRDSFIESDWGPINIQSKRMGIRWFHKKPFSETLDINGVNLGNVLFQSFSQGLIWVMKNYRIAKKILAMSPPDRIIIFKNKKGEKSNFFVSYTDRDSIQYILEVLAEAQGTPIITIDYSIKRRQKISWKKLMRNFLTILCGLKIPRFFNETYFVSGDLKHLKNVVNELISRKKQVALLGFDYQKQDHEFCRAKKITYLLPSIFLQIVQFQHAWKLIRRIRKALKEESKSIPRGVFVFEGDDLTLFVRSILDDLGAYSRRLVPAILAYQATARKLKPKALMLDEDLARRRLLALAFKSQNVLVCAVSHGIPGINYAIPQEPYHTNIAKTFVNSQFEKEKYLMMGWSHDDIYITGTPRYDDIVQIRLKPRQNLNKRKVILYCPHRLDIKKTARPGVNTPGDVTRENTLHLFEALRGMKYELWIKPHSDTGDISDWQQLVNNEGNANIKLFPFYAHIYDLMHESDLVVATFSSVVIEAILFEKSVITLNFTGRPDIHPYAEFSVVQAVYDPSNLKRTIQGCLKSDGTRIKLQDARDKYFAYFCGYEDGLNSVRFVDLMMRLSEDSSQKKIPKVSDFVTYEEIV